MSCPQDFRPQDFPGFPSAARAALLQLQATAMTAGKSTQDERLKQILAPIMKLSL